MIVASGLGSPSRRLLIAAVVSLADPTVVLLTKLRRRRGGRADNEGPVGTRAGDRPGPQV